MGLISSIETRGSVSDPQMWMNTLLESVNYSTRSGALITPDTALRISTVYACVTIHARNHAALPMTVNKRRKNGAGNDLADNHYLYPLVHDSWNPQQSSYDAREMGMGSLKLRGNWYNYIERHPDGTIKALYPLNPQYVQVHQVSDGSVFYQYTPGSSDASVPAGNYSESEIWHVKGFSKDRLSGMSTLEYARESMGLSQSLRDYQADFFSNKAVPGSVLEHPGELSPEARANLKASVQEYAKSKRQQTLILEEGLKWNPVAMKNADAQFLELTQAQVKDIARWFHIPLVLLQEDTNTATFASAEQFMLSFVMHTLMPDVVRVEQSATKALLTEKERRRGYYIKLNMKGLLRGDFKTRNEGYRIAREGGWYSVNDIRALEDEPPVENGDIYIQPLNFKEAGAEDPAPQNIGEQDDDEGSTVV